MVSPNDDEFVTELDVPNGIQPDTGMETGSLPITDGELVEDATQLVEEGDRDLEIARDLPEDASKEEPGDEEGEEQQEAYEKDENEEDVTGGSESNELFSKHADELSRLSIAGLGSAMEDLGLLSNRSEKESNDVVVATFASLDTGKKNYLSSEEFATLYEKAKMPTLADVLEEEHPALVERLRNAFVTWATFGKGNKCQEKDARGVMMGSPSFIKLLRDAQVARSVDDVHIFDVVFAKVKERGASKISFAQFVDGLRLVAEGDHCDLDLMALAARICDASPSVNATQSPRRKAIDGRFEADAVHSSKMSPARRALHIDVVAIPSSDSLYDVFESYARFGTGKRDTATAAPIRLSSQQFAKLTRESGLVSRNVTPQKLDVIFATCRSSNRDTLRGLSFDEFVASLSRIAKEEGVMPEYIMKKVRGRSDAGPMINSPALANSPSCFVRLHDDERACCGVYGRRARRWSDTGSVYQY